MEIEGLNRVIREASWRVTFGHRLKSSSEASGGGTLQAQEIRVQKPWTGSLPSARCMMGEEKTGSHRGACG